MAAAHLQLQLFMQSSLVFLCLLKRLLATLGTPNLRRLFRIQAKFSPLLVSSVVYKEVVSFMFWVILYESEYLY